MSGIGTSEWVARIRSQIQKLKASKAEGSQLMGHMLMSELDTFLLSIRTARSLVGPLNRVSEDVLRGQVKTETVWHKSKDKHKRFVGYAKEILRHADRKIHLKLTDDSSDTDYLNFAVKFGKGPTSLKFQPKKSVQPRLFAVSIAKMFGTTLPVVEYHGGLSFLLAHLEYNLGVGGLRSNFPRTISTNKKSEAKHEGRSRNRRSDPGVQSRKRR